MAPTTGQIAPLRERASQGLAAREAAGAFEDKLDAKLSPGQLRRIMNVQRSQFAAGNYEVAVVNPHGLGVPPVRRVKAKQVSEVLNIAQIIDRDQLDRRLVGYQFQDCAADPSKAVDRNFGFHIELPSLVLRPSRYNEERAGIRCRCSPAAYWIAPRRLAAETGCAF
jgi:hypothetical protein